MDDSILQEGVRDSSSNKDVVINSMDNRGRSQELMEILSLKLDDSLSLSLA